MIKQAIATILKGLAIGAANVIPGVSGGTIALITGVFERLINAIKSFNGKAIALLAKGDFKGFSSHTDLLFLSYIILGMGLAVLSVARLFDYLFTAYPVFIWAFFFGLILASVYFIGKGVSKLTWSVVIAGILGAAIAIGITLLTPARESENIFYLMVCGAVAMCSMILPGLSGSFVLIIMGNYQLVAIDAINALRPDILIPFFIGAGIGLLAFAHLLSWVFKRFRDQTLALLTGFVAGSLGVLWPWKVAVTETFGHKTQVVGYEWNLPLIDGAFVIAMILIAAGISLIFMMEYFAGKKPATRE
jgi:putative membrane protein